MDGFIFKVSSWTLIEGEGIGVSPDLGGGSKVLFVDSRMKSSHDDSIPKIFRFEPVILNWYFYPEKLIFVVFTFWKGLKVQSWRPGAIIYLAIILLCSKKRYLWFFHYFLTLYVSRLVYWNHKIWEDIIIIMEYYNTWKKRIFQELRR